MEKLYVCPKCSSRMKLHQCEECGYKIQNKNGIYDFLIDQDYKFTFDEIGSHYYQNDKPLIQEEIAKSISKLLSNGNILDLGCGDGALTFELSF